MILKTFELPYNYDMDMIDFYQQNAKHARSLFLPPYKVDSSNTLTIIRSDTTIDDKCYMPISREDYEKHLKAIRTAALEFVVLWQFPKSIDCRNHGLLCVSWCMWSYCCNR